MPEDDAAPATAPVRHPDAVHTDDPERWLRSYGRRKSHRVSPRQERLVREGLAAYRVPIEAPAPDDIRGIFGAAVDRVALEIGFGGGEHLLARATAEPRTGFIGCEPFFDGLAHLFADLSTDTAPRVRVYDHDARDVLDWLPSACLDQVYLLYPDPWPKRRHHKRRFVTAPNLDRLARVMRPGSPLTMATDWPDYARTMLMAILAHPAFRWTATRAVDWRNAPPGWPGTRYEKKGLTAGRPPIYILCERIAAN